MNFLLKALNILKHAKTVIEIITPVVETLTKLDLNKDGKVG